MLAALLGLLAGGLYGTADFAGGLATRRMPPLAVTALSQSVGLGFLLLALPFFGGHPTLLQLVVAFAGGTFGGAGIALLYHALSIGKMGVVSPITAVLAAALPVGFGIVRGDALRPAQFAGIAIALVAVVMISLSKEPDGKREIATAGVKEAIASGLTIGVFFLALGTGGRAAGMDGLLFARLGSLAFLFAAAAIARVRLKPAAGTMPLVAGSGAMDMCANVLFVIAAQTGALAVAAVLTSLYPAATALLARVVLRERLQLVQKIGVAVALAGVALIAA